MTLIRPFAGLRPAPEYAADVVAPPYDVLSSAEARLRAAGRPWSFLHISKAEIDLPESTGAYADEVYATAAASLRRMLDAGILRRDSQPCYYIYRLRMGEHVQTGLVAAASVQAYLENRIRKHEFTRPDKEDDRVRQIVALNAQTGPVLLACRSTAGVTGMLEMLATGTPEVEVTADDDIVHSIWVVRDIERIDRITREFDAMDALYIADGHHRSAAAARVAEEQGLTADSGFLAVIFPHSEMRILDYNRVIRDLAGMPPETLLASLTERFSVQAETGPVTPSAPAQFGMYLAGQWYRLTLAPEWIATDPVGRLDVSLLATHVLEPLLGISDPRRDARIDFVGGIRGLGELSRRVDSGAMAVAFALFPTRMDDLMAVADAGEVMPPKSTWFEPKLADGLVSLVLD